MVCDGAANSVGARRLPVPLRRYASHLFAAAHQAFDAPANLCVVPAADVVDVH